MRIKILGTAAYERVPAMFCRCPVCLQALRLGGRDRRTQAQALIDEALLVDFGQDNYQHFLSADVDYTKIENLLITHAHDDHFKPNELAMMSGAYGHNDIQTPVTVWGNAQCRALFEQEREMDPGKCVFRTVEAYVPVAVGAYTVTPLPANHGTENPFCYIISDGQKHLLYNHDTNAFVPEVYEFLGRSGYRFDCVLCDCTCGLLDMEGGHMSLKGNVVHRSRLEALGVLKAETKWIITHFSHNALFRDGKPVTAEEMEAIAAEKGMICAWDGMEVEL